MKRKKIVILGALIIVVSMIMLLLPLNALFAATRFAQTGCITVIKRDVGGNLLAGAGFTIYHSNGDLAAPEGFTDDSGMITFCGLDPTDSYRVVETTAPAGFRTAPDQIATFGITAQNDTVALAQINPTVILNFVDEPTITRRIPTRTTTEEEITVLGVTEELPFTGQSMILYIIGALMLALAGGLTFVLRAVKSKE